LLFQVEQGDLAHVPVEYLFVVVVPDLHYPVAGAIDSPSHLALAQSGLRRVQRRLQRGIQAGYANRAAVHGTQHLDLIGRKAELARNTRLHQLDHQSRRLLGILLLEDEEIARMPVVEHRHFATIDSMCVGDDITALRLAEDRVQPDNGRIGQPAMVFDRGNDVSQHVSGADAGQLVYVANQQQVSANRDCFQQMIGQQQIQHRCFIDDHQVCLQRVFFVALKDCPFPGLEFEQPVDRLGRMSGGL